MDRPLARPPVMGGPWSKLSLTPWILDVILQMGFEKMTPVQASTIPRAIKNQDCVVEAVTGSGKTLAFVVPILERLCRSEHKYAKGEVAAIVVAPTRELAQQIHDIFHRFLSTLQPLPGEDGPVASSSRSPSPAPAPEPLLPLPMLLTSGTKTPYETFASLHPSILVGTPGRLASFLLSPRGQSLVRVGDLDVLVLDEADRLLSSPDHRRDVERIMRHLPKQRRTHLFSATMTDAVEEIIGIGLRNPVRIVVNLKDKREGEIMERRLPTGLDNRFLVCRAAEKTLQLVRLLRAEQGEGRAKFIVYFSTCAAVDYFYRVLSRLPVLSAFALTSLHGDLPPRVREQALSQFTSHPSSSLSPAVLLCTDVAARGVDFSDIDLVVQYDPPTDPKTFSHRAGRTARAGRTGKAVVLLTQGREEDYVAFLAVRKIPLAKQEYIGDAADGSARELDAAALQLMDEIRDVVKTDRDLADKGAKAYVSALRAYTKHEASFIFRLADADFNGLGVAYGLLRLPAMPEITEWRKKRADAAAKAQSAEGAGAEATPWSDAEIDWDAFAYTNKTREAARLAALANKRAKGTDVAADAEQTKKRVRAEMREAWSEQKDRKARREERRVKKDTKKQKEWEREQAAGQGEVGMVDAFMRARAAADGAGEVKSKVRSEVDREMEAEYKAMKKEVKEERVAKRAKREEKTVGGMFDDLE